MNFNRILTLLILTAFLSPQEMQPEEILSRVLHRLDGIDHQYFASFKQSRKNHLDKQREFWTSVHWPLSGSINKMVNLRLVKPDNMKGVSYWEHRNKAATKPSRWMTLPVTGKLKDVSDKKKSRKEFDLSELEITQETIDSNEHQLLGTEELNGSMVYVLESTEGRKKEKKKLWIDAGQFFIHKAEFTTKSGRLYREVNCSEIKSIDSLKFPTKIEVSDYKSKFQVEIEISRIVLNPDFDLSIFQPKEGLVE